jgi:signal transduction histidine kinase
VAIRQARLYEQSQREIVERRRAEERIRQQKDLLENTIEALDHPFYVINVVDYTIEMANTAAWNLAQSAEAITCYALSHRRELPCDGTEHPCPLKQVVRTKEPVTLEHVHYDANGDLQYVEVYGYPLFDLAGSVVQMIEYALDITERKQAEQASREAAAAAERERLARDLHDSVSQALFSATLVAEILPQVWQRDPDEALQGVTELCHLTRGALAEMRTLLLELRPAALVESRLDELLQQLTTAVTGRAEILIMLDTEPIPMLPPDVHLTFYRIGQEALYNVVKHANADHVAVDLRALPPLSPQSADDWQGTIRMEVRDDGCGFDLDHTRPGQLGLSIMRERAEAVGATLTIESQPGQGTQVTLIWSSSS